MSIITGFDLRSLSFSKDEHHNDEFYLFMDLRKQYQWVTYKMSALAWVQAASLFNTTLENKKGKSAVRKTPRALMEKLEEVEKVVHHQIKHNDFMCESHTSGGDQLPSVTNGLNLLCSQARL